MSQVVQVRSQWQLDPSGSDCREQGKSDAFCGVNPLFIIGPTRLTKRAHIGFSRICDCSGLGFRVRLHAENVKVFAAQL